MPTLKPGSSLCWPPPWCSGAPGSGEASARAAAESLAFYAPPFGPDESTRQRLETLRVAAEGRHLLRIGYVDLKARRSERIVRPLGCFYWGAVWTLAAWCEARAGFRNFRVDRIDPVEVFEARFRDEPGKTLADLFRAVEADRSEWPGQAGG